MGRLGNTLATALVAAFALSASAGLAAAAPGAVEAGPTIVWNTFLGGIQPDGAFGIARDAAGNIFVTGETGSTWGAPKRPYTGLQDAFVAKLTPAGMLKWCTFLGGAGIDVGYAIGLDKSGNVLVAGKSDATWGTPKRP